MGINRKSLKCSRDSQGVSKPICDQPTLRDDWFSANGFAKTYVGGIGGIRKKLLVLRNALIEDVHACELPLDATEQVDTFLIGWRKDASGRKGLFGSPDIARLLNLEHKEDSLSVKPARWVSAAQLSALFVGGREKIEEKLRSLADSLVNDMVASGICEKEAMEFTDQYMMRRVKPPRGPEALAASQALVRVAEDTGIIRQKTAKHTALGR